jgi:hypothetical protein
VSYTEIRSLQSFLALVLLQHTVSSLEVSNSVGKSAWDSYTVFQTCGQPMSIRFIGPNIFSLNKKFKSLKTTEDEQGRLKNDQTSIIFLYCHLIDRIPILPVPGTLLRESSLPNILIFFSLYNENIKSQVAARTMQLCSTAGLQHIL